MSRGPRSAPSPRSSPTRAQRTGVWVLLAITIGVALAASRPPAAAPPSPDPAPSAGRSAAPVTPEELERRLDALEAELER